LRVTVFSILSKNPKKTKKDINSKPTKQNKSNPKNKKLFSILSNKIIKKIYTKVRNKAKLVEKRKRRRRRKHKPSRKRKEKKKKRKCREMIKETHTNISKKIKVKSKTKSKLNIPHTYQQSTIATKSNNKTKKHALKENITPAPITKIISPSSKYEKKQQQIKDVPISKNKIPNYIFHNKKTLLKCGDIESNPGPRSTLLSNHPQVHLEKQKTYFYNKTTQIKPEYNHILELFKPYLNHTQITNINPHLTQFCRNNNHCLESYIFYAILITLAPTPTQCNQLIGENSTQWTTNLIRKLLEWPNLLPIDQHKLINFHLENSHITKPLESIQKELYSFITNEQLTIQHKFPYLPVKMILEALKCLQPIPNYMHPNPIQNHPPINLQNTPYTNPSTKYCGTLNTALPGLQSLANKPTPPSIIAIQETKLTASKSTKYLQRLFPQYKMIFNNTNISTQIAESKVNHTQTLEEAY
jgi:hypothetical protein